MALITSPFQALRSEWQIEVKRILTLTSIFWGGASWTSSMTRGCPGPHATAAATREHHIQSKSRIVDHKKIERKPQRPFVYLCKWWLSLQCRLNQSHTNGDQHPYSPSLLMNQAAEIVSESLWRVWFDVRRSGFEASFWVILISLDRNLTGLMIKKKTV